MPLAPQHPGEGWDERRLSAVLMGPHQGNPQLVEGPKLKFGCLFGIEIPPDQFELCTLTVIFNNTLHIKI